MCREERTSLLRRIINHWYIFLRSHYIKLQKMILRLQHYSFKLVAKRGGGCSEQSLPAWHIPQTCWRYQWILSGCDRGSQHASLQWTTTNTTTGRDEKGSSTSEADSEYWRWVANRAASTEPWSETILWLWWRIGIHWRYIVFKVDRAVIPASMRAEMLKIINESHMGIVKCKQLARDILYWPGFNKQIEDTISKCSICQQHRSYQTKEPLLNSEGPKTPWSMVAANLFECIGATYLVVVDYYSEFIEIEKLENDTRSSAVIEAMSKIFAAHGIPDKVITDNGPQFASYEFSKFTYEWNFFWVSSSPTHSQSNGMAEKAVQTAKNIITKCSEDGSNIHLALLNLSNTPRDDSTGSPVQRLFGHMTRTRLPTTTALLRPQPVLTEDVQENLHYYRERAKSYYDRGSKQLSPLKPGDTVRVRHGKQWIPAQMVPRQQHTELRSYDVLTPSGRIWRHNRRNLLKTRESDIFRGWHVLGNDCDIVFISLKSTENVQQVTLSCSYCFNDTVTEVLVAVKW